MLSSAFLFICLLPDMTVHRLLHFCFPASLGTSFFLLTSRTSTALIILLIGFNSLVFYFVSHSFCLGHFFGFILWILAIWSILDSLWLFLFRSLLLGLGLLSSLVCLLGFSDFLIGRDFMLKLLFQWQWIRLLWGWKSRIHISRNVEYRTWIWLSW